MSAAVASMLGLAVPATAAIVEFDVGGLFMEDVATGDLYTPTGTFRWDNGSFDVFDVNVTSPFASYGSGSYDYAGERFTLFGSGPGGATELVIELFGPWFNDLESGSAGDTFSFSAYPEETESGGVTVLGAGIDPTLYATILPGGGGGGPAPVPLPASGLLLIAGCGALTALRRRRKEEAAAA